MAGGETVKSLLQQLASYYRAVWQRAWSNTWQALGADMRLAFVSYLSLTAITYGVAYYTGGLGEVGSALPVGVWGFVILFGPPVMTVLLYFLSYLFITPSKIDGDKQKEITELQKENAELNAELKSQLERRLDLNVNIPLVSLVNTKDFPPLPHIVGGRGQVIKVEDLVLTNRSKASRVNLWLTLCVRGDEFLVYRQDTENPKYLRAQSYKESYGEIALGEFLSNPINIAPEDTKRGNMYFFISSEVHNDLGLNLLPNHSACVLEIVDLVSGKMMTKNIDQKFIESPTARLVKLEEDDTP